MSHASKKAASRRPHARPGPFEPIQLIDQLARIQEVFNAFEMVEALLVPTDSYEAHETQVSTQGLASLLRVLNESMNGELTTTRQLLEAAKRS